MTEKTKRLSPHERLILRSTAEKQSVQELSDTTSLSEIAVLRSGTYLEDEGLVTKDEEERTRYHITERGASYVESGLPEIQVYEALSSDGTTISDLQDIFDAAEVNASIGRLKKHGAVQLEEENELRLIPQDDTFTASYTLQDALEDAPHTEETEDVKTLVSRGLLHKETTTITRFERTEEGDQVLDELAELSLVDNISSDILEQGTWKGKTFRSYRITGKSDTPRTGRKHFVKEAIDDVKDFWVSLGFKEMRGDHVQSAFWDLDALFVPQDHPARDLQDTFYLDIESDLPDDYVERVKAIHEDGGSLESDGWQEPYDESISQQTLLRTHTTVLSAQKFAELDRDDLPKKYFSVDKNYRNETIDWSHLMEFHQVEGIVVTENGSLSRLISYLDEFFGAMGYDDVRLRPAYFPYTEPSAEVDAYNEEKDEWVEIGGAGVIRPEVTKPLLGFECPVLAWGTGLERLLTAYYDIHDLRKLYDNDMNRLQSQKVFTNAHYIN
jgi:phenylalanyl-tRNA synthetase alpha chain